MKFETVSTQELVINLAVIFHFFIIMKRTIKLRIFDLLEMSLKVLLHDIHWKFILIFRKIHFASGTRNYLILWIRAHFKTLLTEGMETWQEVKKSFINVIGA